MHYSPAFLVDAYRTMKTIRLFEERCILEFERGNIPGFVHAYNGQEAVAVGVCMHLSDSDVIGSTHRGHGHCIAKGCDVIAMMKEIMGKATGLCKGKGGSMHIADFDKGMLGANAIVGGAPPLCNGAALSAKTLGTKNVAVSFGGDGSSNQGTVMEALNLAVVLQLPHIFVVENNGYGEGTGARYAVGCESIGARTAAFGMPAATVDGTDFFAVYEQAGKFVELARNGGGPSAIEADVVRFDGHFIGDPQLYRGKDELKTIKETRDCLKKFRARVTGENWLKAEQLDEMDAEIAALIERAVEEGMNAPLPEPAALFADVYSSY
ncbi:MAG: thiamine pyrophosphate-dependent dehydrogenase E1 component subunit alpha [Pseudomonadota bacterium]|nr:thiamine pyrophosphate-dependent dehydrogenase E1 component subunit alpha [Pseudomonadota bacterium]